MKDYILALVRTGLFALLPLAYCKPDVKDSPKPESNLLTDFNLEDLCDGVFAMHWVDQGWDITRPRCERGLPCEVKITGPLSSYEVDVLSRAYFKEAARIEPYCSLK